jgi:hypothetical protein
VAKRYQKPGTKKIALTIEPTATPKELNKAKPRGKITPQFLAHSAKPGEVKNPTGKNQWTGHGKKTISEAYRATLSDDVPDELFNSLELAHLKSFNEMCKKVGKRLTFADLIALGMTRAAATGQAAAAKEIREVTEGRLPETLNLEGKIDYSAGQSAKDVLAGKLGSRKK